MNEAQRQHTLDVAKAIEQNPCLYRQDSFMHECGTPACVAGWSVAVSTHGEFADVADLRFYRVDQFDRFSVRKYLGGIESIAGDNLGLTLDERTRMFDVDPYHGEEPATAAEAIEMLRHRAATGEVRWPERS